jgi:hypothetical protein
MAQVVVKNVIADSVAEKSSSSAIDHAIRATLADIELPSDFSSISMPAKSGYAKEIYFNERVKL